MDSRAATAAQAQRETAMSQLQGRIIHIHEGANRAAGRLEAMLQRFDPVPAPPATADAANLKVAGGAVQEIEDSFNRLQTTIEWLNTLVDRAQRIA